MKFSALTSIALCAVVATADLNVPSVISEFYSNSPPTISPAASTSLASALYSVQSTWQDSPAFSSFISAIYSAAPSAVQSSLATSGFEYAALTTQAWYTKSVPTAVQTAVAGYVAAEDSAAEKILGTPTTSKNAAGARETGVGLMAMGAVVGVVGGVMAVL